MTNFKTCALTTALVAAMGAAPAMAQTAGVDAVIYTPSPNVYVIPVPAQPAASLQNADVLTTARDVPQYRYHTVRLNPNANVMAKSTVTVDMNRLDTNRDGYITMDEARVNPAVLQVFPLIDRNRDNMLHRGEFVSALHGNANARDRQTFGLNFKTLDRNRDGMLTGAEIESQWEPADRNVDGQISEFEFSSWVKDGPEGVANRAIGEGFDYLDRNRDMVLTSDEVASMPALRDRFATLDRNRDRMLDRNELMTADRATFGLNFKTLDRNRDGMLTGAEIESQWEPADRNVDGQISEFEFSSWVNNGVVGAANRAIGENFDMLDANRDRIISMDEAARLPALQSEFAYADRNKNGQLAEWEFDTWLELTGRTAAR